MIISEINGNLITLAKSGRYTEIAHGCNCFCVMGAGIAPQIARAFPEAEAADNLTIRGDKSKMGTFSRGVSKLNSGEDLTIFNLYTQHGTWGRRKGEIDLHYDSLEVAFAKANYIIARQHPKRTTQLMGIPMIGAGLAGGDWGRIEEIINRVTPNIDIELVIYRGA